MEHTPQNNHRLLETRPTEAELSAPRRPTIDASIYCIKMLDNWASMAGSDILAFVLAFMTMIVTTRRYNKRFSTLKHA